LAGNLHFAQIGIKNYGRKLQLLLFKNNIIYDDKCKEKTAFQPF
jgi:hypothetical protein